MIHQRDFEIELNVTIVGGGVHSYRNTLPTLPHPPMLLCDICDKVYRLACIAMGSDPPTGSAPQLLEAVDGRLFCIGKSKKVRCMF